MRENVWEEKNERFTSAEEKWKEDVSPSQTINDVPPQASGCTTPTWKVSHVLYVTFIYLESFWQLSPIWTFI